MECEAGRRHAGIGIKELEVTAVQLDTTTGVTVGDRDTRRDAAECRRCAQVQASGSPSKLFGARRVSLPVPQQKSRTTHVGICGNAEQDWEIPSRRSPMHSNFLLEFWGQRRSRHETGCQVDEWKRLSMGERELAEELINQTVDDCVVEQSCMR